MKDCYLTLSQAARLVPSRPSTNCVWRWCRRGVKSRSGERVRLEHSRIGGRIFVRREALEAFYAALTQADMSHFAETNSAAPHSRKRSEKERRKAVARAERELEKAGI